MTFASLAFVGFFIIISVAYYACPPKARWALLLVASCYFYMAWVPKYILILFALILIDYFLAFKIEGSTGKTRRYFLIASIISNVGILFVFKYFNFFNENVSALAALIHWNYPISYLKLLLPIGLSFHTFQSLSYCIEVYKGRWKPERHLGIYALYVMFFPQLVAGPIERPSHLLPQLKKTVFFDWPTVFSGLRLMGWGFFKKLVIADRLAVSVDYVYGHVGHVPGPSIALAIIFFAFQLYADFSGYTDIARGSARVLGIDIMRNFDRPYFSTSVAEFWRRWHISLSSWFRDYLYYPLAFAGKRMTKLRLYLSTLITFTVIGLWHGANWTFIIFGALQGSFILFAIWTENTRKHLMETVGLAKLKGFLKAWQSFAVFALFAGSCIFFRAPDLKTAFAFLGNLFTGWHISFSAFMLQYFRQPYDTLGFGRGNLILAFGGIGILLVLEYLQGRMPLIDTLKRRPIFLRAFVYTGLILSLIVFNAYVDKQFIYFQF